MSKPLDLAHANLPTAAVDVACAASFDGCSLSSQGSWADPDSMTFVLTRTDGSVARFSGAELRSTTWWYSLREDVVQSIDATLFPSLHEARFRYVARADQFAGGKLIRGSLLSEFFEGEDSSDRAYAECRRLRPEWPDAAVFEAGSIDDAKRLLSLSAAEDEGVLLVLERMAAARAKRAASQPS